MNSLISGNTFPLLVKHNLTRPFLHNHLCRRSTANHRTLGDDAVMGGADTASTTAVTEMANGWK